MGKKITLTQDGWAIHGYIMGTTWDNRKGVYPIPFQRVPLGELTKGRLLSCVQDEFGFQDIDTVWLTVDTAYGSYIESNQELFLENTAQGYRLMDWEDGRVADISDAGLRYEGVYEEADDE